MKVEISIDPEVKETKVIIVTDRMTDEIADLVKRLSVPRTDSVTAYSERGVVIVETEDIIRIFTENKKVFLQTESGIYTVRARLYELEEKLDDEFFVRISNSEIVNIRMITKMDISMTGTIGVMLKGNIKTYASRRNVAKIKKRFGI